MCGILGVAFSNPAIFDLDTKLAEIHHRGPDSQGTWQSASGQVQFGHCRLSIIDLSAGGHQPMSTPDGRYTITYNGEIYNYQELKKELKQAGYTFRSSSDTEVLLYGYAQWGKEVVHKLNGMFAFAIWDEKEQTLFAARDRLGEKPFKYFFDGNRFIFASELKAILAFDNIPRRVDWQAIDLALSLRYVPAPMTGFIDIQKLPAGHSLTYNPKTHELVTSPYWQAKQFATLNVDRSYDEWKTLLWDTFKDSVQKRMISDVPVGAFLSGGLDSSSVVAAMSELSSGPVRTYNVGVPGRPDSEHEYAKQVAEQFGTDHTQIMIEPNVTSILPMLVQHYEEPFFDNSAVPMLVMAKETKKHTTVVLTGDGADELLGGYPNYWLFHYLTQYHKLPKSLISQLIPSVAGRLSGYASQQMGKQLYRLELLGKPLLRAYLDYYAIWQSDFPRTNYYVTKQDLYSSRLSEQLHQNYDVELMKSWMQTSTTYGPMNRAMLADIHSRLADGYLVKVDMAAMKYAIETRPPFLDYRFVELCLSLPEEYKVHGKDPKTIWKDIMRDKLPDTITRRKKMGFGIPIASWMQNEMYQEVRDAVMGHPVLQEMFNHSAMERLFIDHKNGSADYSNHIWSLLLLAKWLDTYELTA